MEVEITMLNFPEINKNSWNINPTAYRHFFPLHHSLEGLTPWGHLSTLTLKSLSDNHQSSKTAGFPLDAQWIAAGNNLERDFQVFFAVSSLQYLFWYIGVYWKDQTPDTAAAIATTRSSCALKIKLPWKMEDGFCWYNSRGKIWVSSQCCGWYLPPTPASHIQWICSNQPHHVGLTRFVSFRQQLGCSGTMISFYH